VALPGNSRYALLFHEVGVAHQDGGFALPGADTPPQDWLAGEAGLERQAAAVGGIDNSILEKIIDTFIVRPG